MKGFFIHISKSIYFFIGRWLFIVKHGVSAPGLKLYLNTIRSMSFGGKNRVGRNCKILIDDSVQSSFVMGKYSWLRDNVEINLPANTSIYLGRYVSVQDNCKLIGDMTISDGCIIAPQVFIASGSHYPFYQPTLTIRAQDKIVLSAQPKSDHIQIDEDCWLGYNVVVNKGTHIGKGCVVGSGARVSGYIPPYSVIVGNSKLLKQRYKFNPPVTLYAQPEYIPYFYEGFYQPQAVDNDAFQCLNKGIVIIKEGDYNLLELTAQCTSRITLLWNETISTQPLELNKMSDVRVNLNDQFENNDEQLPSHLNDLRPYNVLQILSSEASATIHIKSIKVS